MKMKLLIMAFLLATFPSCMYSMSNASTDPYIWPPFNAGEIVLLDEFERFLQND